MWLCCHAFLQRQIRAGTLTPVLWPGLLLHLHGEAATSKATHERQKKTPSKFRDFIICVNHHRYGIFLWCSQRSKRLGGHAGVQTAFQLQHWSSSRARLRALPSPSHSSPSHLHTELLLRHYLCICWREQYREMLMNSPASLLASSRLQTHPSNMNYKDISTCMLKSPGNWARGTTIKWCFFFAKSGSCWRQCPEPGRCKEILSVLIGSPVLNATLTSTLIHIRGSTLVLNQFMAN